MPFSGRAEASSAVADPSTGAHHGDQENQREEGSEGEAPGQDRSEEGRQGSEGARPVTLTLTQSFHRTQDLSGLLKAAASALADCEDDAAAKANIASIAAEAVEKAKANLQALQTERNELADHIATLVRQTGEAPLAIEDGPAPELIVVDDSARNADGTPFVSGVSGLGAKPPEGWYADFGHPAQNGLNDAAVTAAFERSTQP